MTSRRGDVTVETDEQPFNANIDKIPSLRPAFREGRQRYRCQFQLDLGRRRGAGADVREGEAQQPLRASRWR